MPDNVPGTDTRHVTGTGMGITSNIFLKTRNHLYMPKMPYKLIWIVKIEPEHGKLIPDNGPGTGTRQATGTNTGITGNIF